MCLVVVALNTHPRYSLAIAANRDEFHAREARPAQWGEEPPFSGVLAGRDLEGGGTWLGIRRNGRWALLTNVREGTTQKNPAAPSRGELVPAILNDPAAPATALAGAMRNAAAYNGFNLLAGDARSAVWASNRGNDMRTLSAGVHGVSNALLDTPWPKLERARAAVGAWAAQDSDDFAPVFAALADRRTAPDASLPSTGVSLEWERLLSSPFIVSEDYGTRCSTVLVVGHDGGVRFIERAFDHQGNVTGEVDIAFDVAQQT